MAKVDDVRPVLPRPGGLAVRHALQAAAAGPIDMGLPGEGSLPLKQPKPVKKRRRRLVSRSLAVALVVVLTLGGLLFAQIHRIFNGGAGTAAALTANVSPELLKGEGRGRVNILLLGRGGGSHEAPDLTDSMMIASIDPVNHQSTLLSVPRDLWVDVPQHGEMKVNSAWESGEFKYLGRVAPGSNDPKAISAGFQTVDQALGQVLGIEIDYNVLVDFQAFQQAVDAVGGVNIDVPKPLVDPTMAWENHNNPVLARAGEQVFNGNKALIYVRSRETSSDFARAERQRSVLVALKAKAVSLGTLSNPFKLSRLFSSFGDNVKTDLSLNNANRVYDIVKGIDAANTKSISLANDKDSLITTSLLGGQSVVLPTAGLYHYDAIQQFVRSELKDPYIIKENARVLVLNGTKVSGLASDKAKELRSYGYNVIGVGWTPKPDWTQTTLIDLTQHSPYTKHYLEKRLGVQAASQLPPSIPTKGADFVIILSK